MAVSALFRAGCPQKILFLSPLYILPQEYANLFLGIYTSFDYPHPGIRPCIQYSM